MASTKLRQPQHFSVCFTSTVVVPDESVLQNCSRQLWNLEAQQSKLVPVGAALRRTKNQTGAGGNEPSEERRCRKSVGDHWRRWWRNAACDDVKVVCLQLSCHTPTASHSPAPAQHVHPSLHAGRVQGSTSKWTRPNHKNEENHLWEFPFYFSFFKKIRIKDIYWNATNGLEVWMQQNAGSLAMFVIIKVFVPLLKVNARKKTQNKVWESGKQWQCKTTSQFLSSILSPNSQKEQRWSGMKNTVWKF